MQFRQFVDDDLGCASYLIGDESSGEAVVVDPAYSIEQYLAEAEKRHVRITRVLETHTHADHVSGHGRFALEHGDPGSRPSRGGTGVRVRSARRRTGDLARRRRHPRPAHARSPARALLLLCRRRLTRRGAMARHHRRLAADRRRCASRPRKRGGRGRERASTAASSACSSSRTGLSSTPAMSPVRFAAPA